MVEALLFLLACLVIAAAPAVYVSIRRYHRDVMAERHRGLGWDAPYRRPW